MKTGIARKCAVSALMFKTLKFKFDADYKEFSKVIRAINKLRAANVIEKEGGEPLPMNLGRVIILKRKPKQTKLYSSTSGVGVPRRIFNMHSFGYVYKVWHKERILMRYPELYKFRPHRANIKVPLYNNIMEAKKEYLKLNDYYD